MNTATKSLDELTVDDVIVDVQGKRHLVTEPVAMGVDEDGDLTWLVVTDTYPKGREITPVRGPDSILFHVSV